NPVLDSGPCLFGTCNTDCGCTDISRTFLLLLGKCLECILTQCDEVLEAPSVITCGKQCLEQREVSLCGCFHFWRVRPNAETTDEAKGNIKAGITSRIIHHRFRPCLSRWGWCGRWGCWWFGCYW